MSTYVIFECQGLYARGSGIDLKVCLGAWHRFYEYAKGSGIGFKSMPLGLALLLVESKGICIGNARGSALGMQGGPHWECQGVCVRST